MSKNRVVIFGGSGFIGTQLTRCLLEEGHEVRIADIDKSKAYPELWVDCDVRNVDQTLNACEGMDLIYNLAAEHDDDVDPIDLYYQTNVDGARIVCQAAEQNGIKQIIFTSTVAIYGLPESETDESGEPAPSSDYGKSKLIAEGEHREWLAKGNDRSLVIVRPTVVFGADNRRNFFVLLTQIASGKFLMVGPGTNRKSIAYVDNVAAFLNFVRRFQKGEEVFNYVDQPVYDMNALVPLLRGMLGKKPNIGLRLPYWLGYTLGLGFDVIAWITRRKLPVSAIRVNKFCGNTFFNAQKARDTGFVPPVDIDTGLRRTVEFEFPDQATVSANSCTQHAADHDCKNTPCLP